MEPENLLPKTGTERDNFNYEQGLPERASSKESSVETGIEKGAEQKERASEAAAAIADSSFPTTLPTPVQVAQDDNQSSQSATASPLTANDDDLIEKEWVDKAKKIVIDTKEDPYSREEAVNQLQKEYQQKRYGRGVGDV